MSWLDLAEDLEAEFAGLCVYDAGVLPTPRKAVRPAPPPDKRLAALEAAATALLRAAGPKPPAPKVPWTERRAELQRLRREERRTREGRSPMGPKPENAWRCGPGAKKEVDRGYGLGQTKGMENKQLGLNLGARSGTEKAKPFAEGDVLVLTNGERVCVERIERDEEAKEVEVLFCIVISDGRSLIRFPREVSYRSVW